MTTPVQLRMFKELNDAEDRVNGRLLPSCSVTQSEDRPARTGIHVTYSTANSARDTDEYVVTKT